MAADEEQVANEHATLGSARMLRRHREVDGVKVAFGVKSTSPVQTFTIRLAKVEQNARIEALWQRHRGDPIRTYF